MVGNDADDPWIHEAARRIERTGDLGPHLSYATLTLAFAFAASVVYGAWSLNQSQLANVNAQIELLRKDTSEKENALNSELTRREVEIKANAAASRLEYVTVKEHIEMRERFLDDIRGIRNQLTVLEQTRPTTGELSAVSLFVKDQMTRVEERVRQLEQNQFHGNKMLPSPP